MDELFDIFIHHRGTIVWEPKFQYVGGALSMHNNFDGDELSLFAFRDMVCDLGYAQFKSLWFRPPMEELFNEVCPLVVDSDVHALRDLMKGFKEIHVYVEHVVETEVIVEEITGNGKHLIEDINHECIFSIDEKKIDMGWEQCVSDGEELKSLHDESDEESIAAYTVFRSTYDPNNISFMVGQKFATMELFRKVVIDYAVHDHRNISFVKSEKTIVGAKCTEGCQWLIYASTLNDGVTVQVKTYVNEHTCGRSYKIRNMSARWLARDMVNTVRSQPDMKMTHVQSLVNERFGVSCSKSKAFRAKKMAIDIAEGDYREQYGLVRDYCDEIMHSNPGSTCALKCSFTSGVDVSSESVAPHFERMYMCLNACKRGFIAGCRPIIGLDGCHLKGPCGGVLLSALSVDPDEKIFPIAFAVAESETKDSWQWFLHLLLADVGEDKCRTFMSDQQKGLIPAIAEIFPNAEHRFCVKHLHSNFHKSHGSLQLKELMWACAKSSYARAFEYNMKRVREIDVKAWEWLAKLNPTSWTKSAFTKDTKCDIVTNNISESFNSHILDAHERPIISLMDALRVTYMMRFQENRERLMNVNGGICKAVQKKLEKYKKDVNSWVTRFAGDDIFEVSSVQLQFTVNLRDRTCTCRRWNLTGIPCVHSVAAIFFKGVNAEQYVDKCYSLATYAACYKYVIYPINGRDMWPRNGLPNPLAPVYRRKPGRPKKLRRRELDEVQASGKLSRQTTRMKCTLCNAYGHNKRGCKGREAVVRSNRSFD